MQKRRALSRAAGRSTTRCLHTAQTWTRLDHVAEKTRDDPGYPERIEQLRGWIEYYDTNMIRLTREDGPNLFIYKHEILYIADESGRRR